jgi:hypothetical protein
MRFMLMVMPTGSKAAAPPSAKMMQYNKTLHRAGVLLALDELFPASTGARISYTDGKATVTDEATEGIDGYWILQVRSREEAIEWAKRAPMSDNEVIEVRQIHEMPDESV